jgi:hypothetical protein
VQGSSAYAELERALPGGGDGRITIAVLDGPVDLAHPCFAGARLTELPTLAAGSGGGRALAHGTHVASVIFGQPGSAVRGIAPACRGLIAPIFSDAGGGLTCSQLDLARAILLAIEHGAHIINISGGQLTEAGEADSLLGDALAKCEAAGVLVVAAAGNDGCDCSHVPAAVATVLAVGAADRYGAPLAISNWGAAYRANGVLAPGEAIEGALPGGGTVKRTGSSFAAPIVSAFAGLILAQQLARGEEPNPIMARKLLIKGVIKAPPEAAGSGRYLAGGLNPASALGQSNRGRRSIMTTSEAVDTREAQATPYPEAVQHEIAASAAGVSALDADMSVTPSCGGKDCGCGCGGTKSAAAESRPQLVYALGQIGFDFGTESRRDSVAQFMRGKSPTDAKALIKHLASAEGGEDIERLIWTVVLDNTPIYAIQPVGAFANSGYGRILEAFRQQIDLATKRERETIIFAVPGRVAGSVRLMSGETVPVLVPSSRGIIAWDVDAAIKALRVRFEIQGWAFRRTRFPPMATRIIA